MNEQKPVEVKITDNLAGAEYSNFAVVGHPNKDEFHLTFINMAGQSGRVVSKIITTPGHLKRIIEALQENVKKYEEQYGIIEKTIEGDKEIGFKA
jgi:hypothetical protein